MRSRRPKRLLFALLFLATGLAVVPTHPVVAAPPPNVLIIVTDDQRFDQQFVMARTNQWFGRDGTTFVNAYAETPLCCPSRSSILSGKYTHNHQVRGNSAESIAKLDMNHTLQRALRDAGYQTGVAGKWFNEWTLANNPPHFDRWAITRAGYKDIRFNVDGTVQRVAQHSTDFISDQAASMIDAFKQHPSKPWFMYVAPFAPHYPYTLEPQDANAPVGELRVTPSMSEADKSDKPPWIRNYVTPKVPYSVADAAKAQRRSLLAVDRMVDRLMQMVPDNTLAIFMSDNGYMLGEHGIREDKRLPYTESVRIPLLMRWKGRVAGSVVDQRPVLNADVAPTVAAATGVTQSLPDMDGRSLLSGYTRSRVFLEGFASKESPNDVGYPAWRSLISGPGQYIEWLSPTRQVIFREFYAKADRYQMNNLMVTKPTEGLTTTAPMRVTLNRLAKCRGTTGAAACP